MFCNKIITRIWLESSRIHFYIPRPSQRRICLSFPLRIRELVYHHYQMVVPIVKWLTYCHNQWCSACLALLVDLATKFTHFCQVLSSINLYLSKLNLTSTFVYKQNKNTAWLWRISYRLKIFDGNIWNKCTMFLYYLRKMRWSYCN